MIETRTARIADDVHENGTAPVPRLALRPAEAARAIGVSPRKLWALTADKTTKIPHVKFGGTVLYPIRELQNWLAERVADNR